jgi:hypothetical protein
MLADLSLVRERCKKAGATPINPLPDLESFA